MKTLRAYVRKSFIEDERTASPARQRTAVARWASASPHGPFEIVYYEDLDISGRYEANRPGWQQLLSDLTPGDYGVAVEAIDRSHRNVKEFLTFYDDVLEPQGLTLISATQNLDLSTADGRTLATVLMSFAEMESRKASERIRAHLSHLVSQGQHVGRLPFGCDYDPDTRHLIASRLTYLLEPSTGQAWPDAPEYEAPGRERRYYFDALHTLYTLYATGRRSYADVTTDLNQAGWRFWKNRRSEPSPFNRNIVREIITGWPVYAGNLPDGSPGNHEPILPAELCQQVGQVHTDRRKGWGGSGHHENSYVYLLSGILYCGHCGQRLIGQFFEAYDYRAYRHTYGKGDCPEKMTSATALEADIIARLQDILAQRPHLDEIAARVRSALEQAIEAQAQPGNAGPLERLLQARTAYDRLIDLYTEGLIDKEEFTGRRDRLQAEIASLETQTTSAPLEALAELDALVSEVMGQISRLASANRIEQRRLIHSMIARIEVMAQQVDRIEPTVEALPVFELAQQVNIFV